MEDNKFTIREISKKLGIKQSSLQNWSARLGIEGVKTNNRRYYSPEELELFERIQALREGNNGYNTIRRIIKTDDEDYFPERDLLPIIPQIDTETIVESVVQAVQESNEMVDKYAKASHYIGSLEERSKIQTQQIEKLKEENEQLEKIISELKERRTFTGWLKSIFKK